MRLAAFVAEHRPLVVAVAGVTAYRRRSIGPKRCSAGNPNHWRAPQLWVVPNPSGLNAHETIDTLAAAYRAPAVAAGLLV